MKTEKNTETITFRFRQVLLYLLVSEGAENDLVRQCTFVHASAYCHSRDATQRCQFSEFQSEFQVFHEKPARL